MHIEKNICDNILGTLLNVQGKTKDTTNARLDLHDMGIRPELHLKQDDNSVTAPPAPYVLGKDQKIEFCKFLEGAEKAKNPFMPHTPAKNHTCWP
jgi:hypothetical protein